MIRLFYGEDQFSLQEELKNIEREFYNSNFGDINISKFDGENLTYDQLLRNAAAIPFLADRRLIIVKNLIRVGSDKLKEYLAENLQKFPDCAEIIFAEDGEVKKNLIIYKKIQKIGEVKAFPVRKGYELEKWLMDFCQKENIPIKFPAVKKLILLVGGESFRLQNELSKLDLFRKAQGKEFIDETDIEMMVAGENDPNIFDFIDALGARNSKSAFAHLFSLFESGKNENYILTMIVYQFRNMLIVADLISRGVSKQNIASEAGIHPFVAGKTVNLVSNYELPLLKRIYQRLLRSDLDIKTGAVEPRLALEKLLADLTL
ncbi:MAG: DNA polymerase III subunit delta [Candidatus Berkelbacteria bacterium Athens1014_28]|uniref:DNA polymerase III subunit delta n=1 Tax=Candidatus Berkelbacteria bacterium Athens1014_28 TaxID=2017145 RepID=A0A554LLW6_9BACT|nr:MAG: DNA polymerase III subunit delta [Candidatus Berkelbacteria bacterium Athens1014_28]